MDPPPPALRPLKRITWLHRVHCTPPQKFEQHPCSRYHVSGEREGKTKERGWVVLGTVTRGHHPWVALLKSREQVVVCEVTIENRDQLPERIAHWLMR